ncbi:MAG: Maf family nucleotide pyrophosphatase [Prevotella sp.]|nr:Maf family nucleotide pyrophosphatase [Bacteroides sp.]MCM1366629.1 Maf family nucleotide pyrophosphatase [Prevotella sp.]MCM1436994.1 Maf family nucleotide pyrophosphatase [Prevotella sp.]
MLKNLKKYRVLLGSQSPRRRELLRELRIEFTPISVGNKKEDYPKDMDVMSVPQFLAEQKARAFMSVMKSNELLITADTIVINDGKILGKPHTKHDALNMLMSLSGKVHKVATGVAITTLDRRVSFTSVTDVKFADINEDEANYYIDNYSPMDKAGAYGIQEWIGCIAVEKINGSFYNVMGLPVHQLYSQLKLF